MEDKKHPGKGTFRHWTMGHKGAWKRTWIPVCTGIGGNGYTKKLENTIRKKDCTYVKRKGGGRKKETVKIHSMRRHHAEGPLRSSRHRRDAL